MKYLSLYRILVLFILVIVFILLLWNFLPSEEDRTKYTIQILNDTACIKTNCSIDLSDVDEWVYFQSFIFDMDKQCEGLIISNSLRKYMDKNSECNFLIGFKNSQAKSFIKGNCQSDDNNAEKIFFENLNLTRQPHQIISDSKINSLTNDMQNGDNFIGDEVYGKKIDTHSYVIYLNKKENLSNLSCFSFTHNS